MPLPPMQFDRADFSGQPLSATCSSCGNAIHEGGFKFLQRPVCANCATLIGYALPADNAGVFWRSVGVGAVVAAGLAMVLVVVMRSAGDSAGWMISLAAIGVGWSVGSAMRRAAGGAGGRRYQVAAGLLIYAAVSVALFMGFPGTEVSAGTALFALIFPFVLLFSGNWHTGLLLLFITSIGVRWAWRLLGSGPCLKQRKV